MIKIHLSGHYGQNCYTDDYMEYAIKRTFDRISKNTIEWTSPEHADTIILGGGSLLGSGIDGGIIDVLKNNKDCKAYIFGTGFREIRNDQDMQLLKYMWDRASLIAVRGFRSMFNLYKAGLDTTKILMCGDPIFLMCADAARGENDDEYIGGVIRPGYDDELRIIECLEYLSSKMDIPVRLFSFSEGQRDNITAGTFKSYKLGRKETYEAVAKSSFWFGNRLHPFCIALIHSVPTIGIDIEFDKVGDVSSSIGCWRYLSNGWTVYDFKNVYNYTVLNRYRIIEHDHKRIEAIRSNLNKFAVEVFGDIQQWS